MDEGLLVGSGLARLVLVVVVLLSGAGVGVSLALATQGVDCGGLIGTAVHEGGGRERGWLAGQKKGWTTIFREGELSAWVQRALAGHAHTHTTHPANHSA